MSVLISSYNRSAVLGKCLDQLVLHVKNHSEKLEVLVVDNASTDQTKEMVLSKMAMVPFELIYVSEPTPGLSNARNKGAHVARAPWLFYLDDDGLVIDSTFNQLFETIYQFDFDFFGGSYQAYHAALPPDWLPKNYGNKKMQATTTGPIGQDHISGGIMVIKKSDLLDNGGFKSNLGMRSQAIGYGEESELQHRLQKAGYKLGLNPHFLMLHLVGEHKYHVGWHVRAAFAQGRDGVQGSHQVWRSLLWVMPVSLIRNAKRWAIDRSYSFDHLIYDTFVNPMVIVGYLWSKISHPNGG
ncbi:MAG: glycosyltransferase family 2 protein [Saprospiraceae bacterium]|nr:glycosyltransferase family 2 protein [Saprospiraceae bacterium]